MGKHSHDIPWKKYKEILDFDGYYNIKLKQSFS